MDRPTRRPPINLRWLVVLLLIAWALVGTGAGLVVWGAINLYGDGAPVDLNYYLRGVLW